MTAQRPPTKPDSLVTSLTFSLFLPTMRVGPFKSEQGLGGANGDQKRWGATDWELGSSRRRGGVQRPLGKARCEAEPGLPAPGSPGPEAGEKASCLPGHLPTLPSRVCTAAAPCGSCPAVASVPSVLRALSLGWHPSKNAEAAAQGGIQRPHS